MNEEAFPTLMGLYKSFIDVYQNGTDEEKMLSFASAIYFLDSEGGSYIGYKLTTIEVDPLTGQTKKQELYNYLVWLLRIYAKQDMDDLIWWLERRNVPKDFKYLVKNILDIDIEIKKPE